MAVKQYKPLTPGRRFATVDPMNDVTTRDPLKQLVISKKRTNGRDSSGQIRVRHRGGGAARNIRIVDFRQQRLNELATVKEIEYDPNRSARIARVQFPDGQFRYILAPDGLRVGMTVVSSPTGGEIQVGNRFPLKHIPIGSLVCNIELKPGQGGKMGRSAGTSIQLMSIDAGFAQLRLPSTEERLVPESCFATIGMISNPDHRHHVLGKAGRRRHKGWRPSVRGKVMNPVDHPHGGGEGKQPIGMKFPKTPWGAHALGVYTRVNKKYSDSAILHRRKK
ncbi:50S ribosomal protein L2 [Candidatus Uhrbacteria bacterium]|nr:50S ribosomal protein L2 [Candidatus Uhrbacteria bacterium]